MRSAIALFANLTNLAPMAKGGAIPGCLQRGRPGGDPTGFSPFVFLCRQGTSVNDNANLHGLSDDDPHRIVMPKGSIVAGIPDSEGPGVLLLNYMKPAYTQFANLIEPLPPIVPDHWELRGSGVGPRIHAALGRSSGLRYLKQAELRV